MDDEKLVRRGILGLIDWEKYGMEVVGDSGSGEETLEFLRKREVDLLFSDLEMPGLSGIPFLQEARLTVLKFRLSFLPCIRNLNSSSRLSG